MKIAVLIADGVLVLLFFMMRASPTVSGDDARRLVAGGARLLDVRSPGEFASGHIEGAVNIPVDELGRRLGELQKDGAVVVYCQSGMRSARARRLLEEHGFAQVHDLGGISRW